MEVIIYGCGAIGSVLATVINLCGQNCEIENREKINVHLIGRKTLMELIKDSGIYYLPYVSKTNEQTKMIKIPDKIGINTRGYRTYTSIKELNEFLIGTHKKVDYIFFTMKAHALEKSVEESLELINRDKPVIILAMNGLGLVDVFKRLTPYEIQERIIECSVGYPSKLEGNVVTNSGGNSFFAFPDNDLVEKMQNDLFNYGKIPLGAEKRLIEPPIRIEKNFKLIQWKKAVANIAVNGISAISMLSVGGVLERKTLKAILKALVNETIEVAGALGVSLPNDTYDWLISFASKDPDHKTSTYQDILKNKKTEIDYFNGYIVKKAAELNIETPANRAIYDLIKIIENSFQ